MYAYELMLVFHPDFDIENTKKRDEAIRKILGQDAKITDLTVIGKKQLAYPIKKQTNGVYVLIKLESEKGMRSADIDTQMQLGDDVIRGMLKGI